MCGSMQAIVPKLGGKELGIPAACWMVCPKCEASDSIKDHVSKEM